MQRSSRHECQTGQTARWKTGRFIVDSNNFKQLSVQHLRYFEIVSVTRAVRMEQVSLYTPARYFQQTRKQHFHVIKCVLVHVSTLPFFQGTFHVKWIFDAMLPMCKISRLKQATYCQSKYCHSKYCQSEVLPIRSIAYQGYCQSEILSIGGIGNQWYC